MAFFLHLPRKYTKLYFIVRILQLVLGVKVVFVPRKQDYVLFCPWCHLCHLIAALRQSNS